MPDILLNGATGYTGRLAAAALQRRNADFAIAGRDAVKLKSLASATGSPEIRVVPSGDVEALTDALSDVRVLITCVGPFAELGHTAIEAAVRAGVHYVDSTGEGSFIRRLVEDYDRRAREAGIAVAPALGFDEVPGDVAVTLAAGDLDEPAIDVTYALPRTASSGTLRSALGIVASTGPWLEDGALREIAAGEEMRWSPLPPPLGPRPARSFPLALGHLAPRHIDARTFRTYVTVGPLEGAALRYARPLLKRVIESPLKDVIDKGVKRLPEGPTEEQRKARWTILAEARGRSGAWRNVTLVGSDFYGLTAETLSAAAMRMSATGYEPTGVLAPVEALGLEAAQEELERWGVAIEAYAPV
ncbi:MAG: saccharopine dehydrogenase family protein [Actinomycetota bacterium]